MPYVPECQKSPGQNVTPKDSVIGKLLVQSRIFIHVCNLVDAVERFSVIRTDEYLTISSSGTSWMAAELQEFSSEACSSCLRTGVSPSMISSPRRTARAHTRKSCGRAIGHDTSLWFLSDGGRVRLPYLQQLGWSWLLPLFRPLGDALPHPRHNRNSLQSETFCDL